MIKLPIPSLEGLETERLRFRRLIPEDISWWMDYMNSAEAIRFMPFTLGSRSDGQRMIERAMDRHAEDGSGLHALVLRGSGMPVGQCGLLTQVVDGVMELEIGYHLVPAHWGNGYAAEAAIACRCFAAGRGLAPSVISLIDKANVRSQGVAKRNGMKYEKHTVHRGIPALVFRSAPLSTVHPKGE